MVALTALFARPARLPPYLEVRAERIQRQELALLALAGLFILLNLLTLTGVRAEVRPLEAAVPLVWAVCMALAHATLNRFRPIRDPILLPLAGGFAGWGLILMDRLEPELLRYQLTWLVVATLGLAAVVLLPSDLRWLRRFRYTWLITGLALLAATLLLGVNPAGGGPRLWLNFGGVYFQPSEILKLLLVVFLASYLHDKREILLEQTEDRGAGVSRTEVRYWVSLWLSVRGRLPYLAPLLVMWGLSFVLLVWQRDLGAASLFFIVFLGMLYLASGQRRYLLAGAGLLILGGFVGYRLFDVVQLRVDAWLNPWDEARTRAFQIVQSLYAMAAGGLLGRGLGLGAPTFIPVVYSDFVFAAIAEEYGLAGAVAVVAGFAMLVARAARAATLAHTTFRTLLAGGIALVFGAQAIIIMGGNARLIPLTGVTLPFLSYGGSSLLVSFIMIGLLLQVSTDAT
jgi:peptidoglycan glycosyltransferase